MDQNRFPETLPHPDRRKTARRKQDLLLVRRERELEAARRISQELSQHIRLEDLVENALSTALDVLNAENGSLLLADPDTAQLVFHHSIGEKPVPKGMAFPWHEGIAGSVFNSGHTSVIEDAKQDKRHYPKIDEIIGYITRDMIVLPLKQWDGDPIGVIEVMNKRHGKLDGEDVALLTIISALTAAAIKHFRLFENQKLEDYIEFKLGDFVKGMKSGSARNLHPMLIRAVERPLICHALRETNGNQIQAADLLGMNRNTPRRKIAELHIPVKREKA